MKNKKCRIDSYFKDANDRKKIIKRYCKENCSLKCGRR